MRNDICSKCGCTEGDIQKSIHNGIVGFYPVKIIVHHVSYDPEEIKLLCRRCHYNLHKKLRNDKKCNISPNELKKKSITSQNKQIQSIHFSIELSNEISLYENHRYNNRTGGLSYTYQFLGVKSNNKNIKYIDEKVNMPFTEDEKKEMIGWVGGWK